MPSIEGVAESWKPKASFSGASAIAHVKRPLWHAACSMANIKALRKASRRPDLNQRPVAPKATALPGCATSCTGAPVCLAALLARLARLPCAVYQGMTQPAGPCVPKHSRLQATQGQSSAQLGLPCARSSSGPIYAYPAYGSRAAACSRAAVPPDFVWLANLSRMPCPGQRRCALRPEGAWGFGSAQGTPDPPRRVSGERRPRPSGQQAWA